MPYREIPVETKVNAVMDHIKGLGPSEIEKKYQVDRDSLRLWSMKAKTAIAAALTPNPGRPSARSTEKFGVSSQKSQKSAATEPAQAFPPEKTVSAGQCPLCGGSRLVRNGWYTTGGKRIPLEQVQRVVCRDCGANLYQSKKTPAEPAPLLACLSGGESLRPAARIEFLPCHDLAGSAHFPEDRQGLGRARMGLCRTPLQRIRTGTAKSLAKIEDIGPHHSFSVQQR